MSTKTQFIEKTINEIKTKYLVRMPDHVLAEKLSECWDMARTQKIELKHGTKKYYRGWSKLGKIMYSLTSKQEEGKA